MSTTKHRYHVPTVTPEAVSLSDFEMDDILEYVHQKADKQVHKYLEATKLATGCIVISAADTAHIETLALCGQREHAREELLRIASEQIGRPI